LVKDIKREYYFKFAFISRLKAFRNCKFLASLQSTICIMVYIT
jgi:hypothetical protein